MSLSAIGAAIHEAHFARATTLFDADDDVRVNRAPAAVRHTASVVTMGPLRSTQEPATMGISRGRDEEVVTTMLFARFEAGNPENIDDLARDGAFDLLNRYAEALRSFGSGDTTLGGLVQWCFLTSYDAERIHSQDPKGSLWEIEAEFTSRYRIRG